MNNALRLIFILLFLSTIVSGQTISGRIVDADQQPLPYVSIYIKNTTIGTISNDDGYYMIEAPSGTHDISYRYVGYQTVEKTISVNDKDQRVNITLNQQKTELTEVVIAADREDPAYAIIRKAIAKRKLHLSAMPSYQCDVYVKGHQKILKAPEKIFGREVGDLNGALDSTRSGIVYLSESVSELHADGAKRKEIVKSSKISGNPQGYSFNSAKEMEMNFYENSIDLNRQLVSPIADNALAFYKYRLLGTFSADGRVINQIQVEPKRTNTPAFSGTIYITDDLYNIHSLQLYASPDATQIFVIDTLSFSQIYVPINGDQWGLFSNTITFGAGMMGFELAGEFSAIYSGYELNPDRSDDFFDSYEHVVLPESNERDSTYWDEIRPVPLTVDEEQDYHKKDSIYTRHNDPMYMDSVDREANQFGLFDVISGYSYRRRSKGVYLDVSSPLSELSFNTVQGLNSKLSVDYRKYFDKEETRRVLAGASAQYGWSEKKLRGEGYIAYRPNRTTPLLTTLRGGRSVVQINEAEPITPLFNAMYSLFTETNHAKFLDLSYLSLSHQRELATGLLLRAGLSWERRAELQNNTSFSFVKKDVNEYTANSNVGRSAPYSFDTHQALLFNAALRIRFGQKYVLRPNERFSTEHKGPTIHLQYTGALTEIAGDVGYHKLAIGIMDDVNTGVTGRLSYYLNGGIYMNQKNMNLRDYRHFYTSQTLFTEDQDYSKTFLLLPYYSHSTSEHYIQAHVEHHFDGYLLDRIPLLNRLSWHVVAGAKYLKTKEKSDYAEFHVGLDNIGYRVVRLFRVDAVLAVENGERRWGTRISIGL